MSNARAAYVTLPYEALSREEKRALDGFHLSSHLSDVMDAAARIVESRNQAVADLATAKNDLIVARRDGNIGEIAAASVRVNDCKSIVEQYRIRASALRDMRSGLQTALRSVAA